MGVVVITDEGGTPATPADGAALFSVTGKLKYRGDGGTVHEIVTDNNVALAAGSVTATMLASDSVTTAKILDANVTGAKLAADAVETAKIKDANVTDAKLAADAKVGSLAALTTTAKTSAVAAINEVDANADAAYGAAVGGAAITDGLLTAWTEAGAYEAISATYTSGILSSATVKWPDASAGTLTVTDSSVEFNVVDGYTITHVDSSKTVTQAAVTRDADGNITTKPALAIA